MSVRTSRRLLWAGLVLMLPLPMLLFGGLVPVARYWLLAGVAAGLIAAEGWGSVPAEIFALFFLHALVYTLLTWLLARWLARALAAAPGRLAAWTLALLAAGVVVTSAFHPFVTPFAPVSPRANLLHVLE
jgi:hypothetical protein